MNGRCETDPLDGAVDVCDSCYGEYCDNCLVRPKGRRHPVCTDCALIASGVRGNAKPKLIGSKRTAKKRREALSAQPDDPSTVFQYFDSEDPLDATSTAEVAKKGRSKRRKKKPDNVSADTEPDHQVEAIESPQEADGSGSNTERASALPGEGVAAGVEAEEVAANGTTGADGQTDATDELDEGEDADAPSTSAVAKLMELRKEAAGPHDRAAPSQAEPTADEAATAASADSATSNQDEPVDETVTAHTATSNTDKPVDDADAATATSNTDKAVDDADAATTDNDDGPNSSGEVEAEAAPIDSDESASATASSDNRRTTDQAGFAQPTTAPMIGEVRTIGGRRSDDVQESQDPLPTKAPAVVGAGAKQGESGHNGIEEFDAERPAEKPTGTDGSGADTDDGGNWIPPILRGMATDAREASANLPHRRRPE